MTNPVSVSIQLLRAGAVVPSYQTALAAGMDLSACPEDGGPIDLPPGEIRLVPCGFAIAIPEGFEGQVRPRSGLSTKFGVGMPNAPGTIDADYRGEVKVPLINWGSQVFRVEPGMRVAQLVIAPVVRATLAAVETLPTTQRGAGGFGSTGS